MAIRLAFYGTTIASSEERSTLKGWASSFPPLSTMLFVVFSFSLSLTIKTNIPYCGVGLFPHYLLSAQCTVEGHKSSASFRYFFSTANNSSTVHFFGL